MRPIEILLVEDNPGDVRLTREAMTESRIDNVLRVVNDGAAALQYLERKGPYEGMPVPDLVLLDLNLPKVSGHDVLRVIKSRNDLRAIPVVALTTSHARKDIEECYDNHVNCYITKPMSYGPFMDVVRSIEDFWLTRVELPSNDRSPWEPTV